MSRVQEQFEIKFRLHDGSDIGPKKYPAATTIATLKGRVLAQWPKGNKNAPRTVNDVKLINAGKILQNNKTLDECKSPICDLFGGVTTMHVVVRPPRPPTSERVIEKKPSAKVEQRCGCVIL